MTENSKPLDEGTPGKTEIRGGDRPADFIEDENLPRPLVYGKDWYYHPTRVPAELLQRLEDVVDEDESE